MVQIVQHSLVQPLSDLLAQQVAGIAGREGRMAKVPLSETMNSACDDPITLAEAAVLIQQTKKTLHNLAGERGDRPCSAYKRKSGEMVWSYQAMRRWLLSVWPDKGSCLPKDYAAAKTLFSSNTKGRSLITEGGLCQDP